MIVVYSEYESIWCQIFESLLCKLQTINFCL